MNLTYDDIINNMKTAYNEATGGNINFMSELGKRFEAVAAELYSISCYGDFIIKQAFPQSATGEYLERHAQLRGIERKSHSSALGELTFYTSEAQDSDIVIPIGTICSLKDLPYIQFKTRKKATLTAGTLEVTVEARAMNVGEDYNVAANTVTVLVNAPSGITDVTNKTAFTGGCNTETDEQLRERIINSYSVNLNGINTQSIEELILQNDFVIDCSITTDSAGVMNVGIITADSTVTDEQRQVIEESLGLTVLAGASYQIIPAAMQSYSLIANIQVSYGYSDTAVTQSVKSAINEYLSVLKIGSNLDLSKLACEISKLDGVEDVELESNDAINSIIYCDSGYYLKLDGLEVYSYEQ